MKKSFLLAIAAVFVLACSSGSKADPDIPFIKPGSQGGQESGQGQQETSTPKVTTGQAVDITSVGALVENRYTGASKGAYDRGIYYGTSADALEGSIALSSSKAKEGSFRTQLSSLEPETEYFYKAYITVWSDTENKYVDVYGDVEHFTTEAAGNGGGQGGGGGTTVTGLQYLGGYEIPAIALQNTQSCSASGQDSNGPWFTYYTTNANQAIVTHAYSYNGKQYRNWTALIDKTKKAPLWSAFVMQKGAYPDNGVGRSNNWKYDPALSESWQQSGVSQPYSKGHFVASNYRQATDAANRQTFYYTNQAPQYQNSFNDGIWNNLELDVKSKAPSGRDTLYVVVGLLYENSRTVDNIPLPSHFYKCLMKCSFNEAGAMTAARGCAYLFTNEAHSGSYSQGITSIDAVEQRSGWDFFANVPKNLQDTAEAQSASLW